jgi:hypothetical protein
MALFCQNMLEIAAALTWHRPAYAHMTLKFAEHFMWIATALMHAGGDIGMWDEQDGFFYDVLRLPDGRSERLKVRSMVGLLPLCAVTVFGGKLLEKHPELAMRFRSFLAARQELKTFIHDPTKPGHSGRRLAAAPDESKLRRVLATMLDESEFLSPYGIRRAVALPRRASVRIPRGGPAIPGLVPAGRIRYRHVRRQLELAGADLDARERSDHPRLAAVSHVLRR